MLVTYTPELEQNITEDEKLQSNWRDIRQEVVDLISFRVASCNCKNSWYIDECEANLFEIEEFQPQRAEDINWLPQGILAESFFLSACKQCNIWCFPCTGNQDIWGSDFNLPSKKFDNFFDVTINRTEDVLKSKRENKKYPVLSLPWAINGNTYATKYLKEGYFDGEEFLSTVLASGENQYKRIYKQLCRGKCDIKFAISGYDYINRLKKVVNILDRNIL